MAHVVFSPCEKRLLTCVHAVVGLVKLVAEWLVLVMFWICKVERPICFVLALQALVSLLLSHV